jgi:FAD dependent oxidoreductase
LIKSQTPMTSRRDFLLQLGAGVPLIAGAGILSSCGIPLRRQTRGNEPEELTADLVIIGGGLGGCAAALSAARRGLRVIMTESTDWIGGQLTAQAVPPDENAWIETVGGSASYQALRAAIRDWYRTNRPLTARARANPRLNPGNGWVSRLCVEPRVALTVLEALLAPHVAAGRVRVLLQHEAIRADVDRDRVRAVTVRDTHTGRELVLSAPFFADATDLGDLLPLTRTEYRLGADSNADTGEPHAADSAQPDNVQGFTMSFAVEHQPGESHVIDKPTDYEFWRDLVLDPPSGPRLISLDDPASRRLGFDPVARKGYWSYRRIIDPDQFEPGTYAGDVTIVNWAQNDYTLGSLADVPPAVAVQHVARAKQQSLSLLYWLQTAAPRADGGIGWPGLRLRPDIMGTSDGLTKAPYIRESRRICAEVTIREQDVTLESRMRVTGASKADARATVYNDSVGIGHYSMDLHRTTRGDVGSYGDTLPFQIPLGALIPQRVENLFPAAKNIGVTHLTNGCYRLHPIEWNVGEAVGELVSFALSRKVAPRAVRGRATLLGDFQRELRAGGVRIAWPENPPR